MYNQVYQRSQLKVIPMVIRVSDINPDKLERYGDDTELDAYCDMECEWNDEKNGWHKYNFEDWVNSDDVKIDIAKNYNDLKSQKMALGYLYTQIKEKQTAKALATFVDYFKDEGITFVK